MKCKQASLLISQKMDMPLSLANKAKLSFHLMRCKKCKMLERNFQFLRNGSRILSHGKEIEVHQPSEHPNS
jgi:hypothetical protein